VIESWGPLLSSKLVRLMSVNPMNVRHVFVLAFLTLYSLVFVAVCNSTESTLGRALVNRQSTVLADTSDALFAVLQSLQPSTRLRLNVLDGYREGRYVTCDPSYVYVADGAREDAVRLADVSEVWRRDNRSRTGAIIGSVVLGLAGMVVGVVAVGLGAGYGGGEATGLAYAGGALAGGLVGMAVGAPSGGLIGMFVPSWRRIYPGAGQGR
jgi:hypothetical protein